MEVGQFLFVLFTFYGLAIISMVENKTYLLVKHQDNGSKYFELLEDNFFIISHFFAKVLIPISLFQIFQKRMACKLNQMPRALYQTLFQTSPLAKLDRKLEASLDIQVDGILESSMKIRKINNKIL